MSPLYTDYFREPRRDSGAAMEAFRAIRQSARLLWWLLDNGLPVDGYRNWATRERA